MNQPLVPSPFRSTAALGRRRRQRSVVERSTFVIASCGTRRVAIAVEWVERVLRPTEGGETVLFGGTAVPVVDLASRLDEAAAPPAGPETRLLVVRLPRADTPLVALRVQAVHEVHAVETATVDTVAADLPADSGEAAPPPAACGRFTCRDCAVWVLDLGRLPEAA